MQMLNDKNTPCNHKDFNSLKKIVEQYHSLRVGDDFRELFDELNAFEPELMPLDSVLRSLVQEVCLAKQFATLSIFVSREIKSAKER